MFVFLFFLNLSVTLSKLLEIKHNTEDAAKVLTLNSVASTTLSIPEREAFEIFLIDNQNKKEIDFFCKALKQKYDAAKSIAKKIEECQINITDIRNNLEHASNNYELYKKLNSQIIDIQNIYRGNLLQLQEIKNEIEMLKHGLKQAQIKVVQKFKNWFGKKESVALDLIGLEKTSIDVIDEKLHQKTDTLLETSYFTTINNNFEFPNAEVEEKSLGIFNQEKNIKTNDVSTLNLKENVNDFPSTSKTSRNCIQNDRNENLQAFNDQIKPYINYINEIREKDNIDKTITNKSFSIENNLSSDLKSFTNYLKTKSKFESMKETTPNCEEAEEVLKHNLEKSPSFSSTQSNMDLELEEESFLTAKKSTTNKLEISKGNLKFFADIVKEFKNPFANLTPKDIKEIKTETLYSKSKNFEEKSSVDVSFVSKQHKQKIAFVAYDKSQSDVKEKSEPENKPNENVTKNSIKPRYYDTPEFVEFMKTIPLTGDKEVDEEIWCFYRNKFNTN